MPSFLGTSGADNITPDRVSAGVIATGGPFPGAGADTIDGGAGDDALSGGGGSDLILGGAGWDVIHWAIGDGADTINGGADTDVAFFEGGLGSETFTVLAQGSHAIFAQTGGGKADMVGVEKVLVTAWDGADTVVVNDLSGTDVRVVTVDLQGFSGLADDATDSVTINGSAARDLLIISTNGNSNGLQAIDTVGGVEMITNITAFDGRDVLTFNLGAGDDLVWLTGPQLPAQLVINGGLGDDNITGSEGADTLHGGVGADTIASLSGDDVITGDDGADLMVWQTFTGGISHPHFDGGPQLDTLRVIGLNLHEGSPWTIHLDATGVGSGRVTLGEGVFGGPTNISTLDVFSTETVRIDGSSESLQFPAYPGVVSFGDNILVGDLTGSGIRNLDIDLGHTPGATADGAIDNVTFQASDANNRIVAVSSASDGVVTVTGLAANVTLHSIDYSPFSANNADAIRILANGGNDVIDLSGVNTVAAEFIVNGGLGNDTIIGTGFAGVPGSLEGGDGNDRIFGSAGFSFIDGGAGADTMTSGGEASFAVHASDHGADVITNFHVHAGTGHGDSLSLWDVADRSFSDLVTHHHIAQVGANVVITDGVNTIVTLQNVNLASLSTSDFGY